MSRGLVLDEEQAQELDAVGFQRATPAPTPTAAFARRRALTHYGCSPVFDIDVRDRQVLPPDQLVIRRGDLVEFAGVSVAADISDGEHDAPGFDPNRDSREVPQGVTNTVRVPQKTKQPGDCAEEMRYAYGDANPWGFQVFDALTGYKEQYGSDAAFEVFRSVLPRRMNLPDMVAHLEGLELDDPTAISVRDQLLTGCGEAANFSREVLDGSAQEIADRRAGSQGKAKYDRRDQKLAAALGEELPDAKQIQVPVGTDPAVIQMLLDKAEENGRLKATIEQQAKAKAPKVKAEASA